MSSAATSLPATHATSSRLPQVLQSTVGMKIAMAVTGVILSGFVLVHMMGNLSAFAGQKAIDEYAVKLREVPPLLWGMRVLLLLATAVHVYAYFRLGARNRAARPVPYRVVARTESTYASRSMYYTGPSILVFVVYHLLHFTIGVAHPQFEEGRVYHNVVTAFQAVPIALIYLLAMGLLALHLWHGTWSLLLTLGLNQPRYGSTGRLLATVFTAIVVLGF